MTHGHTLSVEEHPAAEDVAAVARGLVAFNDAAAEAEAWRRLAVLARDPDGALAGGLVGWTHWRWLFVSHLWLPDSLRGRGLGRELVRLAEREALARGCLHAHLDTFGFQARGFYERLGYEVFGVLEDFPPGHTRYFLRKQDLRSAALP